MTAKAKMVKAISVPKLNEVAMLVGLRTSLWRASRTDDKATKEVNDQHGVQSDMGSYRKLLVDPKALKETLRIAVEARVEHRRLTLPWDDDGPRILSSQGYFKYTEAMRKLEADFWKEVNNNFLPNYSEYVKSAKKTLGTLYDAKEYPSEATIKNKFGFRVTIDPMPNAPDWRVQGLGDVEDSKIQKAMQESVDDRLGNAMKDTWTRLQKVVGAMVERLKAYNVGKDGKVEHTFRDSLVTNIIEVVDLVPLLNITNDQRLTDFAGRIRSELTQYNPEVLRDDEKARKDTTKRAEEILSKMGAFIS